MFKTESFPSSMETELGCSLSLFLFNKVLGVLAQEMRRGKKKIKDIQIGKKEIKLSLLTIGMMVYIENAKAFNKNNNNNLLENKVNSASSQDTK